MKNDIRKKVEYVEDKNSTTKPFLKPLSPDDFSR